jgi:hypothetical protein
MHILMQPRASFRLQALRVRRSWLGPALTLAMVSACHELPDVDHPDITAGPSEKRQLEGSCDLDISAPKGDRVLFLLGMLLEQGGRGTEHRGDHLETFYCDEERSAGIFRRVLATVAKEQGMVGDVREETVQNCILAVRSATLTTAFSSCYRRQTRDGESSSRLGLPKALFMRRGAELLSGGDIAPTDLERRRALAYVSGASSRFMRDGAIVLTAGKVKAELLATLLRALGCADVRLESSVNLVPGATTVRFTPTAELLEWNNRAW